MASENSTTAQALSNLEQIKQGNDPRSDGGGVRQPSKVEKVQEELDRLFEQNAMPDGLDRDDVHGFVANWPKKIGNCKHNTYVESKEYGKRITGRESAPGEFSIGVAARAFDKYGTWLDTVAHELAHVTAYIKNGNEKAHHGMLWKTEASRLGADPTRTDRVAPENRTDPNYIVECTECGHQWERQRESKLVKHPEKYRCGGDCGGTLESWEV